MVCKDGTSCPTRMGQMLTSYPRVWLRYTYVVVTAMSRYGFVELSCVVGIMAEVEFNWVDCVFVRVFLGFFVGDESVICLEVCSRS